MLSMPSLEYLIGTKSRITLLRKLCESADKDFSISELADETGLDKSLVSRTISDLEKIKLVKIRERRNLKLCQINADNSTYRLLCNVFSSERKLNAGGKFPWSA